MSEVEMRMNKTGRIVIKKDNKYVGFPVAKDINANTFICLKNLDKNLQISLNQDGLSKNETRTWMSQMAFMDMDKYTEFFQTFSRSLKWGLEFTNTFSHISEALGNISTKHKLKRNITESQSSDFLFSYKFKVNYQVQDSQGHIVSDEEELYFRILLNSTLAFKAFDISYGMPAFASSYRDEHPFQIVVDSDNPRLEKSLERKSGLAFTLDSTRHQNDIYRIAPNCHTYQVWNTPSIVLLSNREIQGWLFPVFEKLLVYKETIITVSQQKISKLPPLKVEQEETVDTLLNELQPILTNIHFYFEMKNYRLQKK